MAKKNARCRWSLSGTLSSSTSGSGSSDMSEEEHVFSIDEQLGVLYLKVNGEPARSKRTGDAYDKPVVGVRRRDDMMEFTLEDGKNVKLPVADADLQALSQQFQGTEDFTIDTLPLQPHFQSTPKPRAEPRRKRQKILGSSHGVNTQGKFRGVVEVPLHHIKKAAKGLTLVEASHARVESFKATVRANQGLHLPVLPVMVEGESEWEQENPEKSSYILLGGYSIWEALVDLSSEERYSCYRRVLIKVYEGLTPMEALQVGALFQQEQSLLVDDTPTLQAKVALFRRLLYAMHDTDETEEPPTSVKLEWRTQAAASIGVVASTRKELKPLESTFQLALYSKRCYEKLMRLFSWYEEEHGKPMKQSMFISLQGLVEEDRFSVLSKLVNGTMKTEDVKLEATRLKRLTGIKHMFVTLTNKKNWEECCVDYPAHTQTTALDHFINMDFKKAIPLEFVDFVREAQRVAQSGSSSFEHLRMAPVSLAVIRVESEETQGRTLKRVVENLKCGAKNVAVIAEGVQLAAAWQAELKKQGFSLLEESSVIKKTHVCHLITATTEGNSAHIPRILGDEKVFRTLVEEFSARGENIGIGGEMQELSDLAASMGRQVTSIYYRGLTTGNSTAGDQYTFTDSDSTDIE